MKEIIKSEAREIEIVLNLGYTSTVGDESRSASTTSTRA
jgi:hypothetical protein